MSEQLVADAATQHWKADERWLMEEGREGGGGSSSSREKAPFSAGILGKLNEMVGAHEDEVALSSRLSQCSCARHRGFGRTS
jgi:hypothetical protein